MCGLSLDGFMFLRGGCLLEFLWFYFSPKQEQVSSAAMFHRVGLELSRVRGLEPGLCRGLEDGYAVGFMGNRQGLLRSFCLGKGKVR